MTISSQQEQLEALLSEAERHEHRVRIRTILYSLIPIVLAGILLGFTIWQIKSAQDELALVQLELTNTQKELDDTIGEYQQTQQELLQVESELTETQGELGEVNTQLVQKQTELQEANDLIAETQLLLDETTTELEAVQEELRRTQQQVEDLEAQLETLNQDIAIAEEQLRQYREAGTFEPYLCSFTPQSVKEAPFTFIYSYSEERKFETSKKIYKIKIIK